MSPFKRKSTPPPTAFSVTFEVSRSGGFPCVALRPGELSDVGLLTSRERSELLEHVTSLLRERKSA